MTLKQTIQRWHHALVPPETELGWTPYMWLIYLAFLLLPFVFGEPGPVRAWVTGLSIAAFLPLYFLGFRCPGERTGWVMAAIAALGAATAPWNSGASVYFVFAASFAAFSGPPRVALRNIGLIVLVAALETLWLGLSPGFLAVTVIVSVLVGLSNMFWRQMYLKNRELRASREEIQRLAAGAERERIARDLHDLLGHTLSIITLKAELAGRLAASDPARAAREMREVEQVSRGALVDVRQVVAGYRASTVRGELASARSGLAAAGVDLDVALPDRFALSAEYENLLGLVIREAITNVIRHARAGRCRITVEQGDGSTRVCVEDDGVGGRPQPGTGLRGMRERLEAVDGTLAIETRRRGLRLVAQIPVGSATAAVAHDAELSPAR